MAEIVPEITCRVKHIARSGIMYLLSGEFTRDIQLDPAQVTRAGFDPSKVRKGHLLTIDVRIEKDGRLKTSQIRSINGVAARPPGPEKKNMCGRQ